MARRGDPGPPSTWWWIKRVVPRALIPFIVFPALYLLGTRVDAAAEIMPAFIASVVLIALLADVGRKAVRMFRENERRPLADDAWDDEDDEVLIVESGRPEPIVAAPYDE